MKTDRVYVIWNAKHGAYIGPNCVGYTQDLKCAGRFSIREAMEFADEDHGDQIKHQNAANGN